MHILLRVVVLLLATASVLYTAKTTLDSFTNRQTEVSEEHNRLCVGPDAPRYCALNAVPQFKKFVWFVTDGLPVSHSKKLFDFYADHSQIYRINVPGAKYSHAIYSSWLTGQGTFNFYKADKIKGDQIFWRMKEAGFSLRYVGPEWSFLAVSGPENYDALFDQIELHKEPLDDSVQHGYPFFFENSTMLMDFEFNVMPEVSFLSQSLISHTGVFDHINHGVMKYKADDQIDRLSFASEYLQMNLMRLRRFIDQNPDYLLIFSSDHGIDAWTSSGYVMHGFTSDENEGYMMVYNPKLEALPLAESPMIDVVDVSATLSKFFHGVDIPFNSVGMPRNYFGPDSIVAQCKVLMQSIHQMRRLTQLQGRLPAALDAEVDRLLNSKYPKRSEEAAINQFYEELYSTAKQLQFLLYDSMTPPYQSLAIYGALLVFSLVSLWWTLRQPVTIFSLKSIVFLFPLALPLVHLLFGFEVYQIVFNRGSVFFLPSAMLSIWIIFHSIQLLVRPETTVVEKTFGQAVSIVTILNESINWTALALSLVTGPLWKKWLSALPNVNWFCYGLLVIVLWSVIRSRSQSLFSLRRPVHFWLLLPCLFLMGWYELTEADPTMYLEELGGFHKVFVAFAVYGALLLVSAIFVSRSFCLPVLVGSFLFMFLLWQNSPTGRILNIVFLLQMITLLAPQLEASECIVSFSARTSSRENLRTLKALRWLILILFFNQTFYHLTVVMGDAISLSIHPFAGKVGLQEYDRYPTLAAVMMFYHKYSIFLVFVLVGVVTCFTANPLRLLWSRSSSFFTPDQESSESKDTRSTPRGYSLRTLMSVTFAVFYMSALVAYKVLLVNYTPSHGIDECVVFNFTWAGLAMAFFLFQAVEDLIRPSSAPSLSSPSEKKDQ